MLDFCDAPYQFFAPQPSKTVMALSRPLNRMLLRYNRKIHSHEVSGHAGEVKQLIQNGDSILFTPNHPTRTDPQFCGEIIRQLGAETSFMAAYDVFLENRLQAWFMQKNGCFSVDREGNDRKSVSTAVEILHNRERTLTIFPEGNTFQINDRITSFLDGPAFIAAKAQQKLGNAGNVWIVPVSLKYTFLYDVSNKINRTLNRIADSSNYRKPLQREYSLNQIFDLGSHLINSFLHKHTDLRNYIDFAGKKPEQIRDHLLQLTDRMTSRLEKELDLKPDSNLAVSDRIRRARAKIHQFRSGNPTAHFSIREKYTRLAKQAIFTFRLTPYMIPYLCDNPTLDRYAETVARLHEDYFSKSSGPFGPRKAMARVGKPVSVSDLLAKSEGKVKTAIPQLNNRIKTAIQDGIDHLNAANTEIGGKCVVTG